jgi:alanine-glyoxylate transaminase/serine-glyoxylate transaminase/serine-pyruvate transaminase
MRLTPAVLIPKGHDAEAIRHTAPNRFNVSLGQRAWRIGGRVCRIGHLDDLNEPMLLGALTAVEMALRIDNVPHGWGGAEAAMGFLSA